MTKKFAKAYSSSPCGIMFHHFHKNKKEKYIESSITAKEFEKILKYVGIKNILSADLWASKALKNKLKKNEVCITFDDGLKSQYEVALPILKKYKIKCFWFIFSSIFFGKKDSNEVYKFFIKKKFKNFKFFFKNFKNEIKILKRGELILKIIKQKKQKIICQNLNFILLKKEFIDFLEIKF